MRLQASSGIYPLIFFVSNGEDIINNDIVNINIISNNEIETLIENPRCIELADVPNLDSNMAQSISSFHNEDSTFLEAQSIQPPVQEQGCPRKKNYAWFTSFIF